jgi:hypothetical protein
MHGAVLASCGQAWQVTVEPQATISGQLLWGKSTQTLHGSHVIVVVVALVMVVWVLVLEVVDSVEVWMLVQ